MLLKNKIIDNILSSDRYTINIEGIKDLLRVIDSQLEETVFAWNINKLPNIKSATNEQLMVIAFLKLAPILSGECSVLFLNEVLEILTEITERHLFELHKDIQEQYKLSDSVIKSTLEEEAYKKLKALYAVFGTQYDITSIDKKAYPLNDVLKRLGFRARV